MQAFEILEPGNYYHIYKHGVGERDLFYDSENFKYFLNLYSKYIFPIARTYAWALMKNHFHFLVQIKECESKDLGTPDRVPNPVRDTKIGTASSQFSKLFNAYAQSINKRYNFRGSLFERPFKRKLIDDENYLKQVILYIQTTQFIMKFVKFRINTDGVLIELFYQKRLRA
jgi:hypothetical protein